MRPKYLAPTQLPPVAAELAAELPRADAFGHFPGSRGQQAGVGTACHFARLVREAQFPLQLKALLLAPEKQPQALHKLPGTSARHVPTPGPSTSSLGWLQVCPQCASLGVHRSFTPAKRHLLRSQSAGCLLRASPWSTCSFISLFFQALEAHSFAQQYFLSTYYVQTPCRLWGYAGE